MLFRVPVIISHLTTSGEFQGIAGRTARLVTYAMVHFMYVANLVLRRKILAVKPLIKFRTAGEPVQLAMAGTVENLNASFEP